VTQLRLTIPPPLQGTRDEACLDAFQGDLDYVHRALRRLGAAPSEIDDLTQDVFVALRRAWHNYDPGRPIRPYLFGIAFRIASTHQRKRRREMSLGPADPVDLGPNPHELLQSKQARAVVLAALEQIALPRRAVLVMFDLDDVPMIDVAAALEIPLFTAYSRLRKARRELERVVRRLLREVDEK
jgi:RNA polymerase sigma-70 factor (ECF subfamily)